MYINNDWKNRPIDLSGNLFGQASLFSVSLSLNMNDAERSLHVSCYDWSYHYGFIAI